MERATGESRGSVPDLQHDRNVGTAADASVSSATQTAELERADHLVSSNIGRTIQSMRQAVLDTRAAVRWLKAEGYERVGILGTSVGSCIAFLAFAHEPDLNAGAFNHVSGYVADVVWHGLSTAHVRASFGDHLTLDELRDLLGAD